MGARGATASTRTVERALDLLAEVCASGSVTLSECARRAGLPPSTALRLLRTLEQSAFVVRDDDGAYQAGPRLMQLGATALGRESLVRLAEPALQRIVEASGESAYVSVAGPGQSALYVGMVEGTHAIRHTSWVGRTVPLAGTAVGAAFRGEAGAGGFVVERSRVEADATAIAAPILRPGRVAGALSLVGPTYRIDDAAAERFGRIVAREAATLGVRLTSPDAGVAPGDSVIRGNEAAG